MNWNLILSFFKFSLNFGERTPFNSSSKKGFTVNGIIREALKQVKKKKEGKSSFDKDAHPHFLMFDHI